MALQALRVGTAGFTLNRCAMLLQYPVNDRLGGFVAEQSGNKNNERVVFLFLTVVLAPILSVIIVGGYGFLVWITQIFAGPPTS